MKNITFNELMNEINEGDWDTEYAKYIMDNCGGDRIICNGDTLIEAMEDGYLLEDFTDYIWNAVLFQIAA